MTEPETRVSEVSEVTVTGQDGRTLTILVRQRTIAASPFYARTRVAGPRTFTVKEAGEQAAFVEKGVYRIAATGERLTASDPEAP